MIDDLLLALFCICPYPLLPFPSLPASIAPLAHD